MFCSRAPDKGTALHLPLRRFDPTDAQVWRYEIRSRDTIFRIPIYVYRNSRNMILEIAAACLCLLHRYRLCVLWASL